MADEWLQVSFSVPAPEAARSRQTYTEALEGRADALYWDSSEDAAMALLHECLRGNIAVAYSGRELFAVRGDIGFAVPGTVLLMTAAAERTMREGYAMVGLGDDHMPLEFWLTGGEIEMWWRPNPERLRLPVIAATDGLWDACRRTRRLIAEAVPEALSDRHLGAWLRGEQAFPEDFVMAGP